MEPEVEPASPPPVEDTSGPAAETPEPVDEASGVWVTQSDTSSGEQRPTEEAAGSSDKPSSAERQSTGGSKSRSQGSERLSRAERKHRRKQSRTRASAKDAASQMKPIVYGIIAVACLVFFCVCSGIASTYLG
jgi:cobalamin biosynthesis Mg chelatase CobN